MGLGMTHIVEAHGAMLATSGNIVVHIGHASSFKEAKAIAGRYLYQETPSCVVIRRMSDGEVACTGQLVQSRLKWFYAEGKKKC